MDVHAQIEVKFIRGLHCRILLPRNHDREEKFMVMRKHSLHYVVWLDYGQICHTCCFLYV